MAGVSLRVLLWDPADLFLCVDGCVHLGEVRGCRHPCVGVHACQMTRVGVSMCEPMTTHTQICVEVCAHVSVMPVCDSALRREHAWGRVLCGELHACLVHVCVLLERPVMSTRCT